MFSHFRHSLKKCLYLHSAQDSLNATHNLKLYIYFTLIILSHKDQCLMSILERINHNAKICVFLLYFFNSVTGLDGRGRGQWAALYVGGELPYGEWHCAQLGRHEASVGLHVWPRKTQHQLEWLQDPSYRATNEPNQEPGEDHWGECVWEFVYVFCMLLDTWLHCKMRAKECYSVIMIFACGTQYEVSSTALSSTLYIFKLCS